MSIWSRAVESESDVSVRSFADDATVAVERSDPSIAVAQLQKAISVTEGFTTLSGQNPNVGKRHVWSTSRKGRKALCAREMEGLDFFPVEGVASSSEVPRLHPDMIQWNPPEQEQPWRPPVQAGASTSSQRRGQVTATERGRLALGVVRAEGHAGPLTSRGSAPSVASDGSWSVAGSANVKGSLASNAGIPKNDHIDADRVVARATGMAGRSTSSCTSSSASKEVNQAEGYRVDPMLPTLEEPFVNSAFPKGSTVLMRPKPQPSRWADGPTISIREGETSRTAMLRALQARPQNLWMRRRWIDATDIRRRCGQMFQTETYGIFCMGFVLILQLLKSQVMKKITTRRRSRNQKSPTAAIQ